MIQWYIFWSSFFFEDLHISFGLGAHFCRSSFHISKPIIIVMTDFLSHSLFFMFFFMIQVWKCRVVPSRGSQNLVHLPPDMQLNSELIHNDNFLQLTMSSGREIWFAPNSIFVKETVDLNSCSYCSRKTSGDLSLSMFGSQIFHRQNLF